MCTALCGMQNWKKCCTSQFGAILKNFQPAAIVVRCQCKFAIHIRRYAVRCIFFPSALILLLSRSLFLVPVLLLFYSFAPFRVSKQFFSAKCYANTTEPTKMRQKLHSKRSNNLIFIVNFQCSKKSFTAYLDWCEGEIVCDFSPLTNRFGRYSQAAARNRFQFANIYIRFVITTLIVMQKGMKRGKIFQMTDTMCYFSRRCLLAGCMIVVGVFIGLICDP